MWINIPGIKLIWTSFEKKIENCTPRGRVLHITSNLVVSCPFSERVRLRNVPTKWRLKGKQVGVIKLRRARDWNICLCTRWVQVLRAQAKIVRKICSSSTQAIFLCQGKLVKKNLLIIYTSNDNSKGNLSRKTCWCKRGLSLWFCCVLVAFVVFLS